MSTSGKGVSCDYLFNVSERATGEPWISLEPRHEPPAELRDMLIGFDLRRATTFEEGREITRYLNEQLGDLSVTFFK